MANLKQDILNNLGNQKYYIELELARQAQDPNMVYQVKVEAMSDILKEIAELDLATQLVGKYFPEAPVASESDETPETPQAHPGQTHGE